MRISKNISYAEATKSQTATRKGIDNTPNDDQLENMRLWADNIFEPVREFVGSPVAITSFFRSVELNKAIGGSSRSQHCKGQAGDIDCDVFEGKTNAEVFLFVREVLDFDQLIWEFGTDLNPDWVHVSYNKHGNRKQVLKAKRVNGKVEYIEI